VIQAPWETNDQTAEPATSTTSVLDNPAAGTPSTTSPSGSTTPLTLSTTPWASSNGPIPPEQVVVQPEVQAAIDAGDAAPVILKLAVTPVGTDEERIEQVRAARNELLAQLPAGSWTGTDNVGTLPYIALSLDAAGFEATRNSGSVSRIDDDERLFVSASSLEPSSTVSPSSINSTATMGAGAAWAAGWKGAGSTVAVIDTGVQTDHPYLMRGSTKKTIAEACFTVVGSPCPSGAEMTPNSDPIVGAARPCSVSVARCDHGTHVAGIAVGGDGSSLPSGVAPDANLIAINVFYEYTAGTVPKISASTSSINDALSWLYNKRGLFPSLTSVNMSLGGSTKYTNYCDSSNSSTKAFIDQLLTVGITTVIASGNDGWANGVSAPGCISSAVTVGAVDGVPDARTSYSNIGPQVDLMAPGSNITSSILGSQMGLLSGTSMATPAVAGALAVLRQSTPASTLARLEASGALVNASTYSIPSVRLDAATSIYPGPVLTVNAVVDNGSAVVRWQAPVASGLTSIVRYTAMSTIDGAFCTTAALTCTILGLASGVAHPIVVRAESATGFGASVQTAAPAPAPAPTRAPVPNLPAGSPFGSFDVVSGGAGSVSVSGWAIDPESAGPIPVHVYIYTSFTDRAGYVLTANQGRADIGAAFPGYGPGHGFSGTVPSSPGVRIACVFAINVGVGDHTVLGCKFVTVS
jgi:subtilisin family serine protease